ncbi:MAG: hypothetical protein AB4041_20365 [Microcystaceae cyanobacterium]
MKKQITMGLIGIICLIVGLNATAVAYENPITDSTTIMNDQCPGNPNNDDC